MIFYPWAGEGCEGPKGNAPHDVCALRARLAPTVKS